jgi:hypothetical protein
MMKLAATILLLGLSAFSSHGWAQALDEAEPFPAETISPALVVQDADVVDAVATLMQRYEIPVRLMSNDIEGSISGRLANVSVPVLLDRLGALHGFYWYYDGSYVELGLAKDVTAETVKITPIKVDQFKTDLNRLGMEISQFPMSINSLTGVIFVRGPESLLSIIRELADQYLADPAAPSEPIAAQEMLTVNVIHGRQLAVGDRQIVESHSFPVVHPGPSTDKKK